MRSSSHDMDCQELVAKKKEVKKGRRPVFDAGMIKKIGTAVIVQDWTAFAVA